MGFYSGKQVLLHPNKRSSIDLDPARRVHGEVVDAKFSIKDAFDFSEIMTGVRI